jgi:hypothetical protein
MLLAKGPVDVGARRIGLVVVDEINGFATVGASSLVPPVERPQAAAMVFETDRLAFLDTHAPPCATHYMGHNFMASPGAVLADAVRFAL